MPRVLYSVIWNLSLPKRIKARDFGGGLSVCEFGELDAPICAAILSEKDIEHPSPNSACLLLCQRRDKREPESSV